ncbi:MAG: choline dehydrogenase [Alphaproteobacteria bacterium]|nr:choline dehydrogenase [Alphaproteobacteria bacterium]
MRRNGISENYDYVVVGGGSAGCIVANRLSADPNNRVILLEAGSSGRNPLYRVPLVAGKLSHGHFNDWNYQTEPDPGVNDRRMDWPRAKMLGGCSMIAGMMYVRGHPSDFDTWAQLGNRGWSYREVLPYFKRAEDHEFGADEYHGTGGELHVRGPRSDNPILPAYIEAGRQAGYPLTDDFNGESQEGFGRYHFNIKDGQRWSTARAYLDPVRGRPNLTVLTGAHATEIQFDGHRASGITFRRNGQDSRVNAEREIVLCGGAVNSPQLLMLSGIGPADALTSHGIAVRVDLAGVGRNLQDHLDLSVCHASRQPVTVFSLLSADRFAIAVARALLFGTGPATVFPQEAGGFIRSEPDLEVPDLQAHLLPLLVDRMKLRPPFAYLFDRNPVDGHGYAIRTSLLRPHSRGTIELRSADPFANPMIRPNYLSDRRDIDLFRKSVHISRDLMSQEALKPFSAGEIEPGNQVQCDEDLESWIRKAATTEFHPTSTCTMGEGTDAVVDGELRVYGVDGLRVADASIMPVITGGNINAPTMMIGEKAADLVLGKKPLKVCTATDAG